MGGLIERQKKRIFISELEKTMRSKLLIVTTFYNENERLKYTLENMLHQESVDFVHLLIDDGSTDNSYEKIVSGYMSKSMAEVVFEKHINTGINEVHMRAFERTEEFGCSHFMWLDCGDGLHKNAVETINVIINGTPDTWLHLDGYYVSDKDKKVRMSSKSYLPYLKKSDQFLPFCFSISTYGHFVIPFKVYSRINPSFTLTNGFYYDAQIIGALSLNNYPQHYVEKTLSIIQDDRHFSVLNSSANSYRDNLVALAEFVVSDLEQRKRVARISSGMDLISIRKLFKGRGYRASRLRVIELNKFYRANGIKTKDRYKWFALWIISRFYLC